MDKKIERKSNPIKKWLIPSITGIVLIGLLWSATDSKKRISLDKDRITIKEVSNDYFEDMALFNGSVQPLNTLQINTIESGSVKKIHTENGQMVQKGDLLLELYNPNTELGYLTQETAIIEQINNLRNTRISIKNQQMTLDRDLIKMTYDYNNAARQYRMDTTLYGKGVISKNDYLKSQETYDFQTKQQLNTKKYVEKEQYDRKIQLNLINTSIVKMEESLEQLRANKENFIVRAPESGLLSSYNPILGKSYEKGELIGKLDMLDGYKVLVRADEYYFNLLEKDQEGLVELEEGTYTLTVKNIVAEVVGGKFDVELVFNKGAPKTIKQGMTLPIKVYLSNKKAKALLLPKGAFYQSSGGQFVFVLKDGNTAEKRKVSIGRANAYYYEILSGISEGDRIITSSYEGFKEKDIINLK